MTSQFRLFSLSCLTLVFAVSGVWFDTDSSPTTLTDNLPDAPKPVEPDMHEFMEYYFQPSFKRIKPAMAKAPEGNTAWKAIKADSLVLAEGGNLLLSHKPDEKTSDWVHHSEKVRDFGGEFYRAAQAKNFAAARKHYETMIENCNACHQQFADGKHILKP